MKALTVCLLSIFFVSHTVLAQAPSGDWSKVYWLADEALVELASGNQRATVQKLQEIMRLASSSANIPAPKIQPGYYINDVGMIEEGSGTQIPPNSSLNHYIEIRGQKLFAGNDVYECNADISVCESKDRCISYEHRSNGVIRKNLKCLTPKESLLFYIKR